MVMDKKLTVDDVITDKLFAGGGGEVSEALKFVDDHLTALSAAQVAGITQLKILAMQDDNPVFNIIANNVMNMRNLTSGSSRIIESLEKVSLYQQLKGMRLNVGGGGGN